MLRLRLINFQSKTFFSLIQNKICPIYYVSPKNALEKKKKETRKGAGNVLVQEFRDVYSKQNNQIVSNI